MQEPELEGIRIIGGMPTPVVSFEIHQLHCIRSRLTASIVEGDEDDIRAVHYLWALQVVTPPTRAHAIPSRALHVCPLCSYDVMTRVSFLRCSRWRRRTPSCPTSSSGR